MIEDAKQFDQRAKMDLHDGYAVSVDFGVGEDDSLTELHSYFAANYLVTLRRAPLPVLAGLRSSSVFRTALSSPALGLPGCAKTHGDLGHQSSVSPS